MCDEAVRREPYTLYYVPDHHKTQGMCNEAVRREPCTLWHVPDHFKTQDMCNEAVEEDPYTLKFVSDPLTTQKLCDDAVCKDAFSFQYAPDWFVTQQQIGLWGDDDEYCNNDELIEWYDGYDKRKAQKAKIKEELIPIAWHPSRWWDWCVSKDDKKYTEKLFLTI